MTIIFRPFVQDLDESTSGMVARLDAELSLIGAIGLQDVSMTKRLRLNTVRWEFTLQYTTPGPVQFGAAYFSSLAGSSVDSQVAAFFAAHPNYRIHFIQDVSQERRRKLDHDAICCIYATTLLPNCGQDRSRPIIVRPLGNIAAGASGNVQMVVASGQFATIFSVTNRAGFQWNAGIKGYAAARPGTCIWDGYPTCC